MTPIKVFLSVVTILLITGCGGGDDDNSFVPAPQPEFRHFGLDNHIINRITEIEGKLFASTDQGLYAQSEGDNWQLLTLKRWNVRDLLVTSENVWLINYSLDQRYYLAQSTDAGKSWQAMEHDFGGPNRNQEDPQEPILRLLHDAGRVFAVGPDVLALSENNGRNWSLLAGNWDGFATGLSVLALNKDRNDVWYGGQGAIEDPRLLRYSLDTMVLAEFPEISELLEFPSVVKTIVLHPQQPDIVYAGGEGGLIKTDNYGETWQDMLTNDTSRFYFDLVLDPSNANILYTAGWDKNFDDPQPLILEISRNAGQTWQSHTLADNDLFGGVQSLFGRQEQGQFVLYIGLFKGGVFRVTFN